MVLLLELICQTFVLSILLAAGLVLDVAHAQDYRAIRQANENSIVFIHSRRFRKDGAGAPEDSYGTGFIIDNLGHVMTASHVILEADKNTVVQTEGSLRSRYNSMWPLELVKRDTVDVAVAKFPDLGRTWIPVQFGDGRSVPTDAPLYTLGFPGGSDLSSAPGILSGLSGPRGYWQTTIPINHGNSGGPVFDMNGKVVGIASGGNEPLQQVTFVIPEFHWAGLRAFRLSDSPDKRETSAIARTFTFYRSVDHEGEESPSEEFCLPDGYKVSAVSHRVTTINGPGTRVRSVAPNPTASNCVTLQAFVKGSGVVRFGPIIVDHKGRGWLGVDIDVRGEKIARP